MSRFGSVGTQYFDDAGDPLIDGLIFFFEPGTNTAKTTFADAGLTIPNTHPVELSGAGRLPNVFFTGSARAILTTAGGTQIEPRDPVGGDATDNAFSDWNTDRIYNIPDIVVGSDGNFYISIVDGNANNNPTSAPTAWTQIRFIRVWNTNETYSVRQIVQGAGGLLYRSLTDSNLGNDPVTDIINWGAAAAATIPAVIRSAAKTFAYRNF